MPGTRLLIVPVSLRTTDPSIATEMLDGFLSLADTTLDFGDATPFDYPAPTVALDRALVSFDWLRHVRAAESHEADARARDITLRFLELHGRHRRSAPAAHRAWKTRIVARRLVNWLAASPTLIDGVDGPTYDAVLDHINRMLSFLMRRGPEHEDETVRLDAAIAAVYGGLCLDEQDALLDDAVSWLVDELDAQFREDGSHISRRSSVLVEMCLDLLPLKQCFAVRDRIPPTQLQPVIQNALGMIRFMRLGDGSLARFHGNGPTWPDRIAAVLAHDENPGSPRIEAPASGYMKMQRRQSIILMDGGPV
ncbi:MAG: heparinase, partial [Pseudomonadota bacterium]